MVEVTVVCPFCTYAAPRSKFGFFIRPPGREWQFAELLRCPACGLFYGRAWSVLEVPADNGRMLAAVGIDRRA